MKLDKNNELEILQGCTQDAEAWLLNYFALHFWNIIFWYTNAG